MTSISAPALVAEYGFVGSSNEIDSTFGVSSRLAHSRLIWPEMSRITPFHFFLDLSVTALPEQLVINVGDMLERHTNNKLRSTIHRVVNPPREDWDKPRYSIPFFMHPISEMKLNCLPECISESNPKLYEDITAGEFLNERLRELGLLK